MPHGFEKKTGISHFFAAATYSWGGLRRLVGEAAFRHELMAFAGGLVLFLITGAHVHEYLLFVILALALFAFEALNTAIEEIVDRVSPEFSLAAKHAKDLGSFACLCMIAANGLYIAYVVFVSP